MIDAGFLRPKEQYSSAEPKQGPETRLDAEPTGMPDDGLDAEPTQESEVKPEETPKEPEGVPMFVEVNDWYQTIDGNGLFCSPGFEDENGLAFLGAGQRVYVYGYYTCLLRMQLKLKIHIPIQLNTPKCYFLQCGIIWKNAKTLT